MSGQLDLGSVHDAAEIISATLTVNGWSSSAQTVQDALLIADGYAYIVSPAPSSFAAYNARQIYADDVTTDGQITFHCTEAPSAAISVRIMRLEAE